MIERKGLLKLNGQDVTIIGPDIKIGQQAPEFNQHDQDWQPMDMLAETRGKVRIIISVPSLNTSVCDRETRHFNNEASALGEDIVVIATSADLPYTQKNWCAAAGVERVMVVSDHFDMDFGEKYGVWIKERRIHRRAVFIIDADDKVRYVDYMASLGDEPDYDEVLTTAKGLLG